MSKNHGQDLEQLKSEVSDLAEELRSYCDILWDLDTLLWEYIAPVGQDLRRGSPQLHLSILSIRHLIMKQLKELIDQIEQKGD